MRPEPGTLRSDAIAGVPGAVGSVPDGMASAVLVGVNPVYGLYASFAGPIAGGLTASTRLMVITTTTAAALAAGSAVDGFAPGDETNVEALERWARAGAKVTLAENGAQVVQLRGLAQ